MTAEVRGVRSPGGRRVRSTGGRRGLRGEAGKRVDGVAPGRPQSFQDQHRQVIDCSPGNDARPRSKGWNVLWRNGSLH